MRKKAKKVKEQPDLRKLEFGAKLKMARSQFRDAEHTSKGLTLRELGERSRVRFTHIADFEAGRRIPGADVLQRLAIATGLDKEAAVDLALISAIERGTRNAGEKTLRKLAAALEFSAEEIEQFVMEGLSAAGTKQVMDKYKNFPADFLHLLPAYIHALIPNFDPSQIHEVKTDTKGNITWRMYSGEYFAAKLQVTHWNNAEQKE